MATNANLARTGQQPVTGNLVSLYTIDLSTIGVDAMYTFTAQVDKTLGKLRFRGVDYVPTDIQCSGFETSSQSLPRPHVTITNVNRLMSSAAILHEDLIGARFVRLRTYTQYLDDGTTPDTGAAYASDVFLFDQKVRHNKQEIEWELAAAMDQEGRTIPGRPILRDVCMARYRRVVLSPSGAFQKYDYSKAQCPYTGSQAYNRDGLPVVSELDSPSRKRDTCCKKRFGDNAPLPFWGFPGVSRTRV